MGRTRNTTSKSINNINQDTDNTFVRDGGSIEGVLFEKIRQGSVLTTLTRQVYSAASLDQAINFAVDCISEVFSAYVSVSLLEDEGRFLVVKAHNVEHQLLDFAEKLAKRPFTNWKIPLYEDSVIARNMRTGYPTVCGLDFKPDEPVIQTTIIQILEAMVEEASPLRIFRRQVADRIGSKSLLVVPFSKSSGEIIGSLAVLASYSLSKPDYNFVKVAADVIGQAVEYQLLTAQLRESEGRFRQLAENFRDGLLIFDKNSKRNIYVNPAAEKIFGVSIKELLNMEEKEFIDKFIHKEDRNYIKQLALDVQEKREKGSADNLECEYRILRGDGQIRWCRHNSYPEVVQNGVGSKIYLIVSDITERKRSEEKIKSERQAFSIIAEAAVGTKDTTDICYRVLAGLVDVLGFDTGSIQLYEPEKRTLELKAMTGFWADKPEEDYVTVQAVDDERYVATHVARTKKAIFAPDVRKHRFFEYYQKRLEESQTRALISWPILGKNRELLGVIHLASRDSQSIPKEDRVFFETVVGMFAAVLERKRAEQELQASEVGYRTLQANIPVGIFRSTPEGKILSANPRMVQMLGYESEQELIGYSAYETYVDQKRRREFVKALEDKGEVTDFEVELKRKDGTNFWGSLSARAIKDEGGSTHYDGSLEEITDRKKAEQALDMERATFRIIAEAAILSANIPDLCRRVLSGLIEALGFDFGTIRLYDETKRILAPTAVIGLDEDTARKKVTVQVIEDKNFIAPLVARTKTAIFAPDVNEHAVSRIRKSRVEEMEIRSLISWPIIGAKKKLLGVLQLAAKKKKKIPVEDRVFFEGVADMFATVLERKRTEDDMKVALREKEVLLREIHHRVKNNLQVISSLLSLQADYIKDSKMLGIFTESRNRVKTMALIHEKLYQSKELARIDFSDYVRDLTSSLFSTYKVNPDFIALELKIHDVSFDIDTAVPLALIVNELVSNSLEHAFPNKRKGSIRIGINTENDKTYRLKVADDGIGMPKEINFRTTESLGLQLVGMLVEQLRGEMKLDKVYGTEFNITFRVSERALDSG
ncbi:PAS domain S-box protein [candidate division WOR-3 bacterium]|nr:PAS domain S-box protein [candidate division WOR-3 bacterium]